MQAQISNLAMSKVFEKNNKMEILSEAEVQGDQLKKFHLTKFHKVKVKVDEQTMTQVNSWLEADKAKATDIEVYKDLKRTTYAFMSYKMKQGGTCFLLYQASGKDSFVCFYMEGDTSIKEIKKSFGINK